jgi:hypothetical protein
MPLGRVAADLKLLPMQMQLLKESSIDQATAARVCNAAGDGALGARITKELLQAGFKVTTGDHL